MKIKKIKVNGSIRKTKIGTLGVLFTSTFLLGISTTQITKVNADEITETQLIPTTDQTVITIESPKEYIPDTTKDKGTTSISNIGTEGNYTISQTNNKISVSTVEPTKTVETVGTKTTTESNIIEKAQTNYIEDNSKEFGIKEIINEAKDATDTTITTYKVISKPNVNLTSESQAAITSNKYQYSSEKFYHIDNSQEKPSDKIVIDNLFIDLPENLEFNKETSIREYIQNDEEGITTTNDGKKIILTSEMLNPNNEKVKKLFKDSIHSDILSDELSIYQKLFTTSYQDIKSFSEGLYLGKLAPFDGTESSAVERYYLSNMITEEMYANFKADYLRFKVAAPKYLEVINHFLVARQEFVDEYINEVEAEYTNITQLYNNLHGNYSLNVSYNNTSLSENEKLELEKEIDKLPYEIKKNITKLIITDDKLPPASKTENPIGLATYKDRKIRIQGIAEITRKFPDDTNKSNSKEKTIQLLRNKNIMRVFLHELSHVIDFHSGIEQLNYNTEKQNGISNSNEFKEIYNNYIVNSKNLTEYHRKNIEEAFADGFGQYLYHRIYGEPYTRYINIDGNIYTLRLDNKDPEAMDLYQKYYNNGASSPLEDTEFYFAQLYHKLFEQPTTPEVIINTVSKKSTQKQNKLIALGTKSKTEETTIPFTSKEYKDNNLTLGNKKLIQVGKDGKLQKTYTYSLSDKTTGIVTQQVSETILEQPVPEIYSIGTKQPKSTVDSNSKDIEKTPDSKTEIISDNTPKITEVVIDNNSKDIEKTPENKTEIISNSKIVSIPKKQSNNTINNENSRTLSKIERNKSLPTTGLSFHSSIMTLIGISLVNLSFLIKNKKYEK